MIKLCDPLITPGHTRSFKVTLDDTYTSMSVMGTIGNNYDGGIHQGVFPPFHSFYPTVSSTGTKESTPVADVSVLAMAGEIHYL